MPVNQLYATWFEFLSQLLPQERITRIRNLAWLISGMALSRSVGLSHIAAVLPSNARLLSVVKRLDRFLENPAFTVRKWYEPSVRQLLQERGDQVLHLIIDSSQIGFDKQWLVVALAYRHRALPLAWEWVGSTKGHSPAAQQLRLLAYVRTLMPQGRCVLLVGDAEFSSMPVLQQLEAWGWQYVLRQRGQILVRPEVYGTWQPLQTLITACATHRWLYHWQVTGQQSHLTNLLLYWAQGERQPWLLVTNLPAWKPAWHAYRRRMWIEQLFGDVKGHGVHFDATHLRDPEKLSRLAFAVVLLYLGCITFASHALQCGNTLVERRRRRDLSVWHLGWQLIQQRLAKAKPFHWRFNPFQYQTVR
jgi:hypothetical protein